MNKTQLVCICLLLTGCGGNNNDSDSDKTKPEPELFYRPFQGNYLNSWPFDHHYPTGAFHDDCDIIATDDALTWRGEILDISWNTKCHNAHDWIMPVGTPLLAVADGEVIFAGEDDPVMCGSLGEVSAMAVVIQHTLFTDEIFETYYVHLSQIDVEKGQWVDANQQIGLSGTTGCTTGPHLHFAVFRLTNTNNGTRTAVDPFGWNGAGTDPWSIHPDGAESVFLWREGQAPSGDYGFYTHRE